MLAWATLLLCLAEAKPPKKLQPKTRAPVTFESRDKVFLIDLPAGEFDADSTPGYNAPFFFEKKPAHWMKLSHVEGAIGPTKPEQAKSATE